MATGRSTLGYSGGVGRWMKRRRSVNRNPVMSWSSYEVFSVLSGVAMLAFALVPDLSAKDRLYAVAGGVLFVGFGFYVAAQSSGTYYFPMQIFFIPFLVIGMLCYKIYKARTRASIADEPTTEVKGQ
jgi:hypothetical protein